MGVAGSLDVGVWKVLLLDVRRPKLGKLKGIFYLWVLPVFLVVSMAAAASSVPARWQRSSRSKVLAGCGSLESVKTGTAEQCLRLRQKSATF